MIKKFLTPTLLVMAICGPGYSFAKEPVAISFAEGLDGLATIATVATVNVDNARFVRVGNDLSITFNISNRVGIQPEVKYGIRLTKDIEGAEVIVDEKIYDEVFVLLENVNISKNIVYNIPTGLTGEYKVWLESKNKSGFTFATAYLGSVELDNIQSGFFISPESCFLSVVGDNTKYNITQTLDIEKTENMVISCNILNNYSKDVTVMPIFKTFKKSLFGDEVVVSGGDVGQIKLKAQQNNTVSFKLPHAIDPQAYVLKFFLRDSSSSEYSNFISINYVVRGEGATIKNIFLDRDSYLKGDTAKISFYWSQLANFFARSKGLTPISLKSAILNLSISSGQAVCATIDKEIIKNGFYLEKPVVPMVIDLPIKQDCDNPVISAKITNSDGEVYDQKNISLTDEINNGLLSANNIYIILSVLIFLSFIFIFVLSKKIKSGNLGVLLLILFLAVFSPKIVSADTYTVTYWGCGGPGGNCARAIEVPWGYDHIVVNWPNNTAETGISLNISGSHQQEFLIPHTNYNSVSIARIARTSFIPQRGSIDSDLVGVPVYIRHEVNAPSVNFNLSIGLTTEPGDYFIKFTGGLLGSNWPDDMPLIYGADDATMLYTDWLYSGSWKHPIRVTAPQSVDSGLRVYEALGVVKIAADTTLNSSSPLRIMTKTGVKSIPLVPCGDSTATKLCIMTKNGPKGLKRLVDVATPSTPAPVVSISANPPSVSYGGNSIITYSAPNATSCTLSGDWSGNMQFNGSIIKFDYECQPGECGKLFPQGVSSSHTKHNLTSSKTYTVVCTGPGGTSNPASATVSVGAQAPAPTVSITANPSAVAYNGVSTLTWSSTNATGCTASGGWSGTKSVSGSESTGNLTSNKTYTITCTGSGGISAPTSATVTVAPQVLTWDSLPAGLGVLGKNHPCPAGWQALNTSSAEFLFAFSSTEQPGAQEDYTRNNALCIPNNPSSQSLKWSDIPATLGVVSVGNPVPLPGPYSAFISQTSCPSGWRQLRIMNTYTISGAKAVCRPNDESQIISLSTLPSSLGFVSRYSNCPSGTTQIGLIDNNIVPNKKPICR